MWARLSKTSSLSLSRAGTRRLYIILYFSRPLHVSLAVWRFQRNKGGGVEKKKKKKIIFRRPEKTNQPKADIFSFINIIIQYYNIITAATTTTTNNNTRYTLASHVVENDR